MPTQTILPDEMPDIRYYLRNHPYLAALSAGRVFFKLPDKISQAPFLRIYWAGGGVQANSEAPVADVTVAIEVWGLQDSDYPTVRATTKAIQALALQFGGGTILGPGNTRCHNINVTTITDAPDPETGWPRQVIHSIWTVSL